MISILLITASAVLSHTETACTTGTASATVFQQVRSSSQVPSGLVAAEIEFQADLRSADFLREGGRARIVRFLRGTFAGAYIFVSPGNPPSGCPDPFVNGRRGVVLARFVIASGRPTLEPVWIAGSDPSSRTTGAGRSPQSFAETLFQTALMEWVTCEGPRSQELMRRIARAGPLRTPDLSSLGSCDAQYARVEDSIRAIEPSAQKVEAEALLRRHFDHIQAAARAVYDQNNYE